MMGTTGNLRTRLGAILAAGALALTGVAVAGCGDDDNEGPAEEVGGAVDDAGQDAGQELDEAGQELDQEANEGEGEGGKDY